MGIEEVIGIALDSIIADAGVMTAADVGLAGAGGLGAADLTGTGAFGTNFGVNAMGGITDMGATNMSAFGFPMGSAGTAIPESGAFGSSGFGASPLMQSGVGNLMAPAGGGLTAADAGLTSAADLGAASYTPSAMDVLRGGNIAKDVAQGDYKRAAIGGLVPAVIGSGTGIDTGASDLTNAVTSTGDVASPAASVAPDVSGGAGPVASAATAGADFSPNAGGMPGNAIAPTTADSLNFTGNTPGDVGGAASSSSGAFDGLKSLGSSLGINSLKDVAPLAGLGLSAYNQNQANKTLGNMQAQIKSAVAPLGATQQKLLDNFNSGSLSANDTQAIQDWTTSQKAQAQQYYSSAGLGGSSQMTQAMAQIDQQAKAMHDQALENYLTEALATTGAITGPYSTLANQQIAQDAQLQAAAAQVFSATGQDTAKKTTTSTSEPGRP